MCECRAQCPAPPLPTPPCTSLLQRALTRGPRDVLQEHQRCRHIPSARRRPFLHHQSATSASGRGLAILSRKLLYLLGGTPACRQSPLLYSLDQPSYRSACTPTLVEHTCTHTHTQTRRTAVAAKRHPKNLIPPGSGSGGHQEGCHSQTCALTQEAAAAEAPRATANSIILNVKGSAAIRCHHKSHHQTTVAN